MKIAETQPILTSTTIVTLITAVLALLIAFGVPISEEIKVAVIGIVAILAPLAAAWWPQLKTTPLADPTVRVGDKVIPLVRSDNFAPTPQALEQVERK